MKYAIVTGGARGLGLGIVRALLQENVVERVAVLDRELGPSATDFAACVDGFAADVTDEAQVHDAVEALTSKLGAHPDVLCNNAGGGEANWFKEGRQASWHSVEIWRRYVDLNLNSVYLVCKDVVPRMRAGSAICNTSSIAGQLATPLLAAYAAAKAGVISYTRSLALQLGPLGIRVNAVAPGLIYTRIWEQLGAAIGGSEDSARTAFENAVQALTPPGREQTPDDVGHTVAWLCSARANNITGQIVAVDGGITLGRPTLRNG
jgi:NAD(P)-dependent dehydrogenase (short-subunit alcohol dehydrogenase family)